MIIFKPKLHIQHFNAIISRPLPRSLDSSRITIGYFALSGLDILDRIDLVGDKADGYINWVYDLFCPEKDVAGFQNFATFSNIAQYCAGYIASTYSALNILLILGDDLSGVNKASIIQSLKLMQLDDGSFMAAKSGTENDMRFVYCAASISYILDDWSGIDVPKLVDFILKSISYDGGIGQGPNLESHGGSTYCAVATLALTNNLNKLTAKQTHKLVKWLLSLQAGGFMGRPNKEQDTCYAFWVGATLKILDSYELVNKKRLKSFVLASQDFRIGGFSKWPHCEPDPLHTYFSLAGLSMMNFEKLNEIEPTLNLTKKTAAHLRNVHNKWRNQT